MNFWTYINESKTIDCEGITDKVASQFSALIIRGHSISDLLTHYANEFGHLTAARLQELALAHRNWQIWRKRQQQIIKARAKEKIPSFPLAVFTKTPSLDQLDALVRTARLCPRNAVKDGQAWLDTLTMGIDLWTRSLKLAFKEGQLKSSAVNLEHPSIADYDAYSRYTTELEMIASHQWLAMRRGEQEGILKLELQLPIDDLRAEVEQSTPRLGVLGSVSKPSRSARRQGAASTGAERTGWYVSTGAEAEGSHRVAQQVLRQSLADRSIDSLFQELILDDLEPWVRHKLDAKAQQEAISGAAENLAGLLRSPPVKVQRLCSIYLTRPNALVAAVTVDQEGEMLSHQVTKAQGPWLDKLVQFIETQQVKQIVLPTGIPENSLLGKLEDRLSVEDDIRLIKIRPAALSEARLPLTDPPLRLGKMVASAVILARRALDPLKEWSKIDPVNIGIAEYQNDLDADRLRAALQETVELCRLERRRGKRVSLGTAVSQGSTAMARLNPLVKQIADLRPGMIVHGIVTNISHFGAFINIGLPQEGLVHISEMSHEFVSNPNDVVSIGQQVTTHVLSSDPNRGRISLSMKSVNKNNLSGTEHRPRPTRQSTDTDRHRSNISKSQALANLEKLFNK